jgi:hypothetical protein
MAVVNHKSPVNAERRSSRRRQRRVYIIELLRWIEGKKKLRHFEKKTGRIRNASLISEASLKTGGDLLKK